MSGLGLPTRFLMSPLKTKKWPTGHYFLVEMSGLALRSNATSILGCHVVTGSRAQADPHLMPSAIFNTWWPPWCVALATRIASQCKVGALWFESNISTKKSLSGFVLVEMSGLGLPTRFLMSPLKTKKMTYWSLFFGRDEWTRTTDPHLIRVVL